MLMDYNLLKDLSWEKKQVLAANCFRKYCEKYNLIDDAIDKLLKHLYSMEKYSNEYNNLAIWEENGAVLELAGRGDPLPARLEQKIPKNKINEFKKILTYTVEVGLCDMYAAPTDEPYKYLIKCIKILEMNSIEFS